MVAVPADNDKRVDATMTIPTATSEWFDGPPPRSFFSRNREKLFTALLIITLAVAIAVPLSKKSNHAIDISSSVASAEDGVVAAEQIANPVATEGNIITVAQSIGDANDGGAKKDPTNGTGRGNSNTTITTFDGNTSNFIFASDQVLRQSFGATKCPIGQGLWNLQLVTDDYPWETKWELRYYRNDGNGNGASGSVLANGPPDGTNYDRRTKYTGNLCLPAGQYYMRWFDQMGDSICCQHGPGEWVVRVNGGVVLKNDPNDMGYSSKDFPFNVFGSTKGDVSGTFLIMPRPYNPELNIELPDGTIFWLINLPPRFDYATNGLVSGITSITLPPGSEFLSNGTVDMKGGPPLNLERRLLIEEDGIDEMEDDHESLSSTEGMHYRHRNLRGSYGYHRKLATFEGDKTVLAIRVIAADGETTLDAISISNSIFGNGVDAVNLMSQFKACSYNKFTLSKASNRSGSKYGGSVKISNGVTTVRLSSVSTTQGDGAMRNDITKELNTIFGVNSPSQLADFVIYCLPPNTTPEIAYAYINHWLSVFNDDWCTSMSLQMHEIGHDINLSHSNEANVAYEDQTGIMGASYRSNDGPLMCFNAAKSYQVGWYRDKEVTINDSGSTSCFDGIIRGIADYNLATAVLLRIQTRSGIDYFVTFNAKRGINFGTQEAVNLVTVTSRPRGRRNSYAESELVAKLDSGGIYNAVPGYTISVGNIAANVGTAEVRVLPEGKGVCETV